MCHVLPKECSEEKRCRDDVNRWHGSDLVDVDVVVCGIGAVLFQEQVSCADA